MGRHNAEAMNAYIDLRRSQSRTPFIDGPHFNNNMRQPPKQGRPKEKTGMKGMSIKSGETSTKQGQVTAKGVK